MFVDLAWPTWTLTAIGHNLRIHCAPNMILFSNANHPFDGRLNTWRKAWRQSRRRECHWTEHRIRIVSIFDRLPSACVSATTSAPSLQQRMPIYLLYGLEYAPSADVHREISMCILYHVVSDCQLCASPHQTHRAWLVLFAKIYSQSLDSSLR